MHVTKRQGHVVQKFLAELLYSDMTLTSSVVAAIGNFGNFGNFAISLFFHNNSYNLLEWL